VSTFLRYFALGLRTYASLASPACTPPHCAPRLAAPLHTTAYKEDVVMQICLAIAFVIISALPVAAQQATPYGTLMPASPSGAPILIPAAPAAPRSPAAREQQP
jgi:hypothetical protein